MKLFAQHGHQPSDKIKRGLDEKIIDGVIFSPRYVNPDKLNNLIVDLRNSNEIAEIFIDPEFYATRHADNPNNQLGYLTDWKYFKPQRRRDLVTAKTVDSVLQKTFEIMSPYGPSALVSPNIYISESFDSMEAGISLNFINQSKTLASKVKKTIPVYATLAVDYRALLNANDLKAFLNDITALDNPPDGFYILIGRGMINERSDIVNSEIVTSAVIGGWMLINYILSINEFQVINGYSDILTPFLGAVGGFAGATGWWSNLRTFTLGKYIRSERSGGRAPNIKYLSKKLLNRLKLEERENYTEIIPDIKNNLLHDHDYDNGVPDRSIESLQTWEAIASLNKDIIRGDIEESVDVLEKAVVDAGDAYSKLVGVGLTEGYGAVNEYLGTLSESINTFRKLAEI